MNDKELEHMGFCPLDRFIEIANQWSNTSEIEKLLTKGRLLENAKHDYDAIEHMQIYRKILSDFDPIKRTILLSKEGSRRIPEKLEERDREFTLAELNEETWQVRPGYYKLQ